MEDISKQAKSGVSWAALSQTVQPAWEFFVGILLARILTPTDFGIVAMGFIFFSLAMSFANMGISNYLVQRNKLDVEDIDTAQSVAFLAGFMLYGIILASSSWVKVFFKEPLSGNVLCVISIIILINAFTIVPSALLIKNMQFKRSALINISTSIIYGGSALLFAQEGFGFWSLVYSPILSAAYKCLVSAIAARYIPAFGWKIDFVSGLLRFGGPLSLAALLNYLAKSIDFLIIGKFLGAAPLGFYKRAYDLAVIPKERVADSLAGILFPFLCKIRGDSEWTKSAFLKTSKTVAVICIPALSFLMVSSSEVVLSLYGEKWVEVVPAVRIMSAGGMFYSLAVPFGAVIIAFGKSKIYLYIQCFYAISLLIATLIGIKYQIEGVAIGVTIAIILYFLLVYLATHKIVEISTHEYLTSLKLAVCIGVSIIIVIYALNVYTKPTTLYINIFQNIASALLIYAGYFIFSKDIVFDEIKKLVKSRFSGS